MAEKDFDKVLDFLGFVPEDENGTQHIGTCAFCGREGKFSINKTSYLWDCKVCGQHGNIWGLMTGMVDVWFKSTTDEKYAELGKMKGIPGSAFRDVRYCWNGMNWCMPVYNEIGTFVRNVYRWESVINRVYAIEGLEHGLLGVADLVACPHGTTVWVTEGHWDYPAWRWMVKESGRKDVVVGLPGANVFKPEWSSFFTGKNVKLAGDNDEGGDKGTWRIGTTFLPRKAASIEYVCWPDAFKDGYDLRDAVKGYRAKGLAGEDGVKHIESFLKKEHRRTKEYSKIGKPSNKLALAEKANLKVLLEAEGKVPTFEELKGTFAKWLELTEDFKNALAVCLAVCLSNELEGAMLWVYLVGPASCGKSEILGAMSQSERVIFHSSIRPKSLVSGWASGPDPSLLPTFDRKTAIVKDGTLILQSRPEDRQDVFSILRDTYDGKFKLQYGHGPLREYPDLRFNMLIGTTPVIHGENQSEVGERFLRFEMELDEEQNAKQTLKTIDNENNDTRAQMAQELSNACTLYLSQKIEAKNVPKHTDEYKIKIAALAQLCAFLRANVSRDKGYDRDIRYKPVVESASRIASQLIKLLRMLCVVLGKDAPDPEVYALVRKVAFDSCNQFHLDVVRAMLIKGEAMTFAEIGDKIGHNAAFARKRIEDLEQLKVIVRERGQATATGIRTAVAWRFRPVQLIKELWDVSKVYTVKKKLPTGPLVPKKKVTKK